MPDMLILAAPVAVVALWCLLVLLVMLRKWRAAVVVGVMATALNSWTEQIPVNPLRAVQRVMTPREKRFPAHKPEGALRIFEYNLCAKPEFRDRHGQDFVDFMVRMDADILFLPENNPGTFEVMDDTLAALYPYSMRAFEGKDNALFERTLYSRYPLSNPRFYHFDPDSLRREYPMLDSVMTMRVGRQSFIFQADADINGQAVTLLHVHLRSNLYDSAKADGNGRREKAHNVYDNLLFGYLFRQAEAQAVCEVMRHCVNPLIISGDFNDLSGSRAVRLLQDCRASAIDPRHRDRLKNAWWEGGTGLGFTFADQHLRLRLDHILYSKEFRLLNVAVPMVGFSDHRPIVADFEFVPQ